MVYSEEEYKKKAQAQYDPWFNEQLSILEQSAAKQTEAAQTIYDGKKVEKDQEYADLERQNAVQKLINEREVAENMANLGLTDSGLNRTQQTAVQLSAANNAARLQRQKQMYYDNLTRELTATLAGIETTRLADEGKLRQTYNDNVTTLANTWRQADIDAETERIKALASAKTSTVHGFTNAQINKLMGYLDKKDYVSAENYLDIYGDTLSDNDLQYWYGKFPSSYLNADYNLASKYGDANKDGEYNIKDFVRTKKASAGLI